MGQDGIATDPRRRIRIYLEDDVVIEERLHSVSVAVAHHPWPKAWRWEDADDADRRAEAEDN